MELKDAIADLKKNYKTMSIEDLVEWIKSNLKGKKFKLYTHDYEWGDSVDTVDCQQKEFVCSHKQGTGRPEGWSCKYDDLKEFEKEELEEELNMILEVLKLCNYTPDEDGVYTAKTAA